MTELDLNVEPNREIPKWSETRFFGCWNPAEGVGLYAHMGRFRKDLDFWWAHVAAYLPGGELAVARSFGRTDDPALVRAGAYELAQERDGFRSTFDGVAELTTTADLACAPRGDGAGLARVKWHVQARAVTEVWDMYGSASERHEFAGDTHTQCSFSTAGTLSVDDREWSLDGVGWRDHSSGVRAWDGYGSHRFLLAVMPDWSVHAIMLYGPEGEPRGPIGELVHRDGRREPLERFDVEPMGDALGGPVEGDLVLRTAGGEDLILRYELLHNCPITINDDGDNINGIDWEADVTSLVLAEAVARVTTPDGTVGHAFHERGVLRDVLSRPRAPEPLRA